MVTCHTGIREIIKSHNLHDFTKSLRIIRKSVKFLKIKNGELDEITKETEKEEKSLIKKSDKAQKVIEER